jgi:enamine deaminase RidA (YjgF/YER057c/UK114 family)
LAPEGYSNGVVAGGRQVFIAGQIGSSERGELVSEDFVAQVERALATS